MVHKNNFSPASTLQRTTTNLTSCVARVSYKIIRFYIEEHHASCKEDHFYFVKVTFNLSKNI